jgi:hypothetical protein
MLGVTALLGFLPKLFAKNVAAVITTPDSKVLPFELRPDVRAVARRGDTV